MKLLISICIAILTTVSFGQGPQAWPEAFDQEAVTMIVEEIATPMSKGEVDEVLARTVFPFRVGDKTYTKEELKKAFDDVFFEAFANELANSTSYEVMNPDGDSYMNVCMNAPEGYGGSVPVFQLVKGVWMLYSMDLYPDFE